MKEEEILSLDQLLTLGDGSTSFEKDEIPETLIETEYISDDFRPPTRCPFDDGCREYCDWEREDSELKVVCDDGHEGDLRVEDHMYFDLDFRSIIEAISSSIHECLERFISDSRPRYVSGVTKDGVNIYLIVSPSDYEQAVNEICMETLSEDSPALLITPEKSVTEVLEIKSLFSSSNLIYTVPFTMLSEPDMIQNSLSTIKDIKDIERRILRDQDGDHPVVHQVNSNPRHIMTELNHMRLLRVAGELPQSSGIRLEKIGESALSHLFVTYPDTGGEDDRGSNLPDSVFYISDTTLPDEYDPVLGIVDTKSGEDASFRSESVEGKHTEYLERGRKQSVGRDKIAHIFVILGFDGQQEIDFFDKMNEHYEEGEYMVIITAEALALILTAYLAHTVTNELKLVHGNFQTVIYPLLENEAFKESGLGRIVRDVGRERERYKRRYHERDGLMIITEKLVNERIKEFVESPNDVEELLRSYFRPMPTV